MSRNILDSHNLLHEIVIRHEDTIKKRWQKKTKPQRLQVLLGIWPDMAKKHHADLEAVLKEGKKSAALKARYRRHMIWPQINQEDLSRPKMLPLLLSSRGRHHPSEFVCTDWFGTYIARGSKSFDFIRIEGHFMIISETMTAEDYAEIFPVNGRPDGANWKYTAQEGLLILETQEELLGFLVQCCKVILHDISQQTLTTDMFPVHPEPELRPIDNPGVSDSLATMAAEAPYRTPPHHDLDFLESILSAKVSAAKDHFWALREDPGYFSDQLFDVSEHRLENVRYYNGYMHPLLERRSEDPFWCQIIKDVVSSAYSDIETFSQLHRDLQHLQRLQRKYGGSVTPSYAPEEYAKEWLLFLLNAEEMGRERLEVLRRDSGGSPPLRKYFARIPQKNEIILSPPSGELNEVEERFFWVVAVLWEDDLRLNDLGLPLLLDHLERIIESDKGVSQLISERVAEIIGDLSILAQCITKANVCGPWGAQHDNIYAKYNGSFKSDFLTKSDKRKDIIRTLRDNDFSSAVKLGNPSDNRFSYPVEQRRTQVVVQSMRQAEQHLDDFWATLDRLLGGSLNGTVVEKLLSQPRAIRRTPEWIEQIPREGKKEAEELKAKPSNDAIYRPLSTVYIGHSAEAQKTVKEGKKAKTKTRGTPQEVESVAQAVGDLEINPKPERISVDSRSLKVFRVLFFVPGVTSNPGEVEFKDFVHAMVSVGFSAQALYGSAWQFRSSKGLRSIMFHEPHKENKAHKLSFRTARSYGKRLRNAFGWTGETFQLKGKDAK
ncbi:hypothetical protein GGS26DRAFT_581477 [Hypomontagnella submonticulosa]|nr:hypothetical protein GGS26DRAFT_581477 [Hypomontagnella submonticulosa]